MNRWSELQTVGTLPAEQADLSTNAFYDPFGQRVIALLTHPNTGISNIWQLSLDEAPTWRELPTEGPAPGHEIDSASMALDRDGKRALIVGGGLHGSGTWALSLDGAARWSRLGDSSPLANSILGGATVVDARREQLLFFPTGTGPRYDLWSMPFATGVWALQSQGICGEDWQGTTTYDPASDRVLFVGAPCGVGSFSLGDGNFEEPKINGSYHRAGGGAALDAQRNRILFFSGGLFPGNTTAALDLDSLQLSVLVGETRDGTTAGVTNVWDPKRAAVVSFGADTGDGETVSHGLKATDTWLTLSSEEEPDGRAVYDAKDEALISFGGNFDPKEVRRLSSAPGSVWQVLSVPDGAPGRGGHVAVYDAAQQRMVIHGGLVDASYPPSTVLDDTWALSLDDAPTWTRLQTKGESPGKRFDEAAIYDPNGQRLIVYGGSADPLTEPSGPGDLHVLALDDSLEWSSLEAAGQGPSHARTVSAVYDPRARRMIVVDGSQVFALELAANPSWHHFCETGLRLPTLGFSSKEGVVYASEPVLVPDGLFVAVGDGDYGFNLDTPYCD
jgi:hypothetical protein